MAYAFALNGNEPIALVTPVEGKAEKEAFTVEWFKEKLIEAGVSRLHIAWGNYKEEFPEVPAHLMHLYLHHRRRHLHREALESAQQDYCVSKDRPFAR